MSKENLQKITVLGMGGTIAGIGWQTLNNPKEYIAGELGIADLMSGLSHLK
jgi:L-asparaginase/Glu-tRNA(Gln) amidotransferase subunit D